VKIKKRKRKGSILTRAGILEAVFKQGEECSVRGRISAGEEKRTSARRMKKLEKLGLNSDGWALAWQNEPIRVR